MHRTLTMSDYKFFMDDGTKSRRIYILEWVVKISDDAELIISKYQNTPQGMRDQ